MIVAAAMTARRALPEIRHLASGLAVLTALLAAACVPSVTTAEAGPGFGGFISYTGALGPINAQRPLCLCVYRDAELRSQLGRAIDPTNPRNYALGLPLAQDDYAVASVDLQVNERLDPDEPYEIYRDRSAPPAACPLADTDGDGQVHVPEIVRSFKAALGSCGT